MTATFQMELSLGDFDPETGEWFEPLDGPVIDLVAIDRVLAGRHSANYMKPKDLKLTYDEKLEAIRIGLARGISRNEIADALGMGYSRFREVAAKATGETQP